jgi:hypothetical protein
MSGPRLGDMSNNRLSGGIINTAFYRKMNKCRKTVDLKLWFYSFLVNDTPKEATELAKQVKSFYGVQS